MPTSISFDRAADFYDQTRDFPGPVATQGIQAMIDIAGAGARCLDVGTGTGRVSVPLLKHGVNLFGVDLSTRMMAMLRGKFPAARLAQADAALLPFIDNTFDAVLTCHVMHLVGPWREALREYRRVLVPGGRYINAHSENAGDSIQDQVRDHWRAWVKDHGHTSHPAGVRDDNELFEEIRGMGADIRQVQVVEYITTQTVRQTIDRIASRSFSHSWDVPEDIFAASLHELRDWAQKEYPDWDQPQEEKDQFILDVACFEKT
jgi:SAM-dependent methyltransferase